MRDERYHSIRGKTYILHTVRESERYRTIAYDEQTGDMVEVSDSELSMKKSSSGACTMIEARELEYEPRV